MSTKSEEEFYKKEIERFNERIGRLEDNQRTQENINRIIGDYLRRIEWGPDVPRVGKPIDFSKEREVPKPLTWGYNKMKSPDANKLLVGDRQKYVGEGWLKIGM